MEMLVFLKSIASQAAKVVCNLDNEDGVKSATNSFLIYPKKNQKGKSIIRVSEQEFTEIFKQKMLQDKRFGEKWFYSIETPTERKYRFSGKDKQGIEAICVQKDETNDDKSSASTDLTIFEKGSSKYRRLLNIEFKYGAKDFPIYKDILKLIAEPQDGAFVIYIHTAEDITRTKLLPDRLKGALVRFSDDWNGDKKKIYIVVCHKDQEPKCITITKDSLENLDKSIQPLREI